MTTQYGMFGRYSIEKYRYLLDVWPELGDVTFRETYEEAEAVVKKDLEDELRERFHGILGVRWIHHPHDPKAATEEPDDPLDAFGSWGWKTS